MSGYGDVYPGAGRDSITRTGSDRVRPIALASPAASGQLASMGGLLMGWSVRETSGSAAAAGALWDGPVGSGTLIATFAPESGAESQGSFFDIGVDVVVGLYLQVVSGTFTGTVLYRYDTGSE